MRTFPRVSFQLQGWVMQNSWALAWGALILEAELQLAAGGSIVWASVLVVGDKRGLASWWSLLDSRALCRL